MSSIQLKCVFAALPRVERGKPVRLAGKLDKNTILYCNGNGVYIRNVTNPVEVDIYTQHSKQPTIARYSPSGFYIASGDITGKVRIWDTVNKEHILKNEFPVLGGPITDLDWTPDSQKIAAVGDGREKFGHVFTMDSGNSAGEICSHSKSINTVSLRQARPFSMVTASEDSAIGFFKGVPYKFARTQNKHATFVNTARFSPDGEVILSGGQDGKIYKYDGKTCDEMGEINTNHKGGIYEIAFNKDGSKAASASGDKTVKIFDVATGEVECVFDMSSKPDGWQNMQLGCLWQGDEIITVNGFGHLIYHDPNNPTQPKRVIKGHMKPITSLVLSEDKRTMFTCGQEGVVHWDVQSGDCDDVKGKGHSNEVTDMVLDGNNLFSVGIDDALRVISVTDRQFSGVEVKMDSQPKQIASHRGTIVVACVNHVMVLDAGSAAKCGDSGLTKKSALSVEKEACSVSIHPDGSVVAVGFKEGEIRIYSLQNWTLTESQTVALNGGEVSSLAFSPSGAWLAYSTGKKVGVRSTPNYELVGRESEKHTARVCCLAWCSDSEHFASGALDTKMVVFKADMQSSNRPSIIAYIKSHITKLDWLDSSTIITVGHDSNVKQFTLSD
ncbi:hypothetical protein ACOMHN_020683 [Nucella lapillus]